MGKKCPPGVICIENFTLVLIIGTVALIFYIYQWGNMRSGNSMHSGNSMRSGNKYTRMEVNIKTQPSSQLSYSQIGILSRNGVIMPLFGRNINSGRDNWQYYTLTEHGVRLPLSVGGKSSTAEYGCNSISNGDVVHVEGYNTGFTVTIYDDVGQLRYLS